MEYLEIAIKLTIAISVLNVWLIRFGNSTQWRGGNAQNMKDEFSAYGLPIWFMYVIGALKVLLSLLLILSIWYGSLELYAAGGMAFLMIGAVVMHLKVKDPIKKSFPAALFLTLSIAVLLI